MQHLLTSGAGVMQLLVYNSGTACTWWQVARFHGNAVPTSSSSYSSGAGYMRHVRVYVQGWGDTLSGSPLARLQQLQVDAVW